MHKAAELIIFGHRSKLWKKQIIYNMHFEKENFFGGLAFGSG